MARTKYQDGFARPELETAAGRWRFWSPFRRKPAAITEAECREAITVVARRFRLALDRGEIDDKAARVWRVASGKGGDAVTKAIVAEVHSIEGAEGKYHGL